MRSSLPCCLLLALLALPARAQGPPEQPEPVPQGKLTLTIDSGRHNTTVLRAFFNPSDGNQLITLADDWAIRLWDVAEGRTTRVIYPPGVPYTGPPRDRSATMSQDGKRLAVSARYLEKGKEVHVVYVLSLPDGRLEKVLRYPWPVGALAFSPDGRCLASGGGNSALLADLMRDDPPHVVLKGKPVAGLAFSPDGKRMAVGCHNGNGLILDLDSGKELAPLKGRHVAWSPDGKTIATATVLGSEVRMHDVKGKLLHSAIHQGFGDDLRFSPDSNTLLVVGRTGANLHRATLFDVVSGKERLVFPAKYGVPASYGGAFSPDSRFAATVGGGEDNVIFVWGTKDGTVHKHIASAPWMFGGSGWIQPAWSKDGQAVCWGASWMFKSRDPLVKFATFHLGELTFAESLKTEQRPERDHAYTVGSILKQGELILKRIRYDQLEVINKGESVRKLAGADAAFVGPGQVALAHDRDAVVVDALTGKEIHRCEARLGGYGYYLYPSPDNRFLMRLNLRQQTMSIWRLGQVSPLLTLYRKGEDWVIWTEEGYYAATPGGERLMGWKVDNGIDKMPSFYPAERFRKQLHRPDVIKKAFELGSVAAALKALDGDKAKPAELEQLLPPKATLKILKDAGGQVTLQVSAEAQVKAQPVVAVRLLLNGRPLPDGLTEFDPPQAKATAEFTLTLPPGRHTLAVLARSDDASALSEAITVGQIVVAQQPVLHLLAIGINDYQNGIDKLNCAVNDAKDLATAFPLVKQGGLFRDVKTHTLLDKEATASAIRAKLGELRPQLKQEDVLVVFFAGHGVKDDKEFFLLTVEANLKELNTSALSGAELSKTLRDLPCAQVLLLLDACHSGAFPKGLRPATDDAARAFADDEVGVTVLAAAMGHQKALEKDGNGYFTAALKAALAGEGRRQFNERDGRMYVRHLYTYVADAVANRSEERQHPFLSVPSTATPFALRQFAK